MFDLFFNLYLAMMNGGWSWKDRVEITTQTQYALNTIGKFLTSMFNNVSTPMGDLGSFISNGTWLYLVSFVLALITSIGIVVMAVKGVKKAFGIFFMGIRR